MIITNRELADLLEESEIAYMVDRMNAIKDRAGNPEGVEIRRFGPATALYSRTMPWGQFNNVKGLLEETAIDEIIAFYQSAFHTSLYCPAQEVDVPVGDIRVRALDEHEMETYAEIHCLGTGLPLDGKSYVAANNRVLYGRPGWRFYIGLAGSTPAAVAVMFMKDSVASLTFAATLPEYRNRGLHNALLLRRIRDAYENGCTLVVSQAAYCSPSHQNMERVGMKIGYTRSTWSKAQQCQTPVKHL